MGAPNGQCDVSYPSNQSISDPGCEFDVEEERLFGGNRSAALWKNRAKPWQLVDVPNSIMSRLELLLRFAADRNLTGSAGWGEFLASEAGPGQPETAAAAAAPSGQAIAWSKVVLSGWSRGSAYRRSPCHP